MSVYTFMPMLFNMSLTASVAIAFVIVLRLLLKKAPKVLSYALWGIVLFRLLCPAAIGSDFSIYHLLGATAEKSGTLTSVIEYVPSDIVHTAYPSVNFPVQGVSDVINDTLPQGQEQLAADPLEAPMAIAAWIWMAGVLVMVLGSVVSYIRLRRKRAVVVPLRENIFIADDIMSPFVGGLFRPKIYLPCSLGEKEQEYIILHEQHHIRRLDHVAKLLAFLALTIHWFNPLVWIAFVLAGKDMEMSCDEAVIRKVGSDVRADYAASLLTLATGRRIFAGTPLAFGEGDTRDRIYNLSRWKKPAVWAVLLAAAACITLAAALLTNPRKAEEPIACTTYVPDQCLYMNPLSSYAAVGGDSGCRYIVGEDSFVSISRNDGRQNQIDVSGWGWQEFPYTDEEWAAFYVPQGVGGISHISEQYDEMLYQSLTQEKFLLRMDGSLWLVELASNEQMGTFLWSIYSLVPESAMGVTRWEYVPVQSSGCPYFRFAFDMDALEISAVCTQSLLSDFDAPGRPVDHALVFREGDALYWSPIDESGNMVTAADIHFTVQQTETKSCSGTIYIEGNSGPDGRIIYKAAIVGTGLHLADNPEMEGGVISELITMP